MLAEGPLAAELDTASRGTDDRLVQADPQRVDGAGLVRTTAGGTVEETVAALESAVEEAEPLTLVTTVDHSENAQSVGLELPPTVLLVFGNPSLGTPLMQAGRTVAVDLPQSVLVFEDADGTVQVLREDPVLLAERHGLSRPAERVAQIDEALGMLVDAAASGS